MALTVSDLFFFLQILSLIHSTMSRQSAAADEDLSFVFLSFEEKALALGNDLVLEIEASDGIEALENISMSNEVCELLVMQHEICPTLMLYISHQQRPALHGLREHSALISCRRISRALRPS